METAVFYEREMCLSLLCLPDAWVTQQREGKRQRFRRITMSHVQSQALPGFSFVLQREPEVLSGKGQVDGRELIYQRAFG